MNVLCRAHSFGRILYEDPRQVNVIMMWEGQLASATRHIQAVFGELKR